MVFLVAFTIGICILVTVYLAYLIRQFKDDDVLSAVAHKNQSYFNIHQSKQ